MLLILNLKMMLVGKISKQEIDTISINFISMLKLGLFGSLMLATLILERCNSYIRKNYFSVASTYFSILK